MIMNFIPATGIKMLNPFDNFKPIPAGGVTVMDDPYWHARQAEGSGKIESLAPAAAPSAQAAVEPVKKLKA
jgi:hypothetical protein